MHGNAHAGDDLELDLDLENVYEAALLVKNYIYSHVVVCH